MSDSSREQAVETLKELGLSEYEAECFVALSRMPKGTAKEISDVSEVPRTRVYDAARVLESKGLVEVQHSQPQEFRAVGVETALRTLTCEYESRMDDLEEALENVRPVNAGDSADATHEVWALSGETAISNRLGELVRDASREVLLVLNDNRYLPDQLAGTLSDASDDGVTVTVGTLSEAGRETVEQRAPEIDVLVSDLSWLMRGEGSEGPALTRLALVDRGTILVGAASAGRVATADERATIGSGYDNGIVVLGRRLLANCLSHRSSG